MSKKLLWIALAVLSMGAVIYPCAPNGPVFQCAGAVTAGKTTDTLSCVQTGDWIIITTCGNVGTTTPTITCPAGFTSPANNFAGNADGNHEAQQVCYKIATAGDTSASTYTFVYNGTGNGFINSAIMDFRGGSTTWDQGATRVNTQLAMWVAPVTTTVRSDMVVGAWCYGATGSPRTFADIPPPGMTSAYQGGSALDNGMYAAYRAAPLPGTTPVPFVTTSVASSNGSLTFAFGGSP